MNDIDRLIIVERLAEGITGNLLPTMATLRTMSSNQWHDGLFPCHLTCRHRILGTWRADAINWLSVGRALFPDTDDFNFAILFVKEQALHDFILIGWRPR